MRILLLVSAMLVVGLSSQVGAQSYGNSYDYGFKDNAARLQSEMFLSQQRYQYWYANLPPHYQQLEDRISQIYNNYFDRNKQAIPFTRESVYRMAEQIGADQSNLDFVAQRMEVKTSFTEKVIESGEQTDRFINDLCGTMRGVGVDLGTAC